MHWVWCRCLSLTNSTYLTFTGHSQNIYSFYLQCFQEKMETKPPTSTNWWLLYKTTGERDVRGGQRTRDGRWRESGDKFINRWHELNQVKPRNQVRVTKELQQWFTARLCRTLWLSRFCPKSQPERRNILLLDPVWSPSSPENLHHSFPLGLSLTIHRLIPV